MATKQLAPKGQSEVAQPPPQSEPVPGAAHIQNTVSDVTNTESQMGPTPVTVEDKADMEHDLVRRSERVRRPMVRLDS